MQPIKIALIDDNPGILLLVKELLSEESDILVCGEAKNIIQAKTLIAETSPDVILLDLSLDGAEGGLAFLKELPLLNSSTKTIIFSAYEESTHAPKSLKAGAKGYLCKDKAFACLADAIRQVHADKEFVS